jgi:hypothetical protein
LFTILALGQHKFALIDAPRSVVVVCPNPDNPHRLGHAALQGFVDDAAKIVNFVYRIVNRSWKRNGIISSRKERA